MVHTKYKFTPQDIAIFLLLADFSHQRENEMLSDLFEVHNQEIVWNYRQNFIHFRSSVKHYIAVYELNDYDYAEAKLIMKELGISEFDQEQPDYFGAYFKQVKLHLLYSGADYRKMKLRTLLKDFGYQRRNTVLMDNMNRAIYSLGLQTYLRNYEPCNIADIKLDQIVMIRLKS